MVKSRSKERMRGKVREGEGKQHTTLAEHFSAPEPFSGRESEPLSRWCIDPRGDGLAQTFSSLGICGDVGGNLHRDE